MRPMSGIQNVFQYSTLFVALLLYSPRGRVLPIMAYTGRLHPKGVPFSGFRYINKRVGISRAEVYEREGKSVI